MITKEEIETGRRLHKAAFCAPWVQSGPFRVEAEDECSEDCEQDHDAIDIDAPDEYPGGQHVCQHVALTCTGMSRFAEPNGALIVWLRNNAEALLDAAEKRAALIARVEDLELRLSLAENEQLQQAKAAAWDQGYRARAVDGKLGTTPNPYRKDGE